ncbi:ATP-binding protein [Streptomyces sp. NBC_00568]|uniref:ATP-binding protein n=1 Tax=Streptomyces sp. NBC_00568 TaxID=2975779 RepID=UPI002257EC2F|nr:ATP-binding protein [Streptomyces sp. NBC_00568]MCX4993465.1 ATP-binding protein [Streptomyces sp. NBC_00568]
MNSAKEDDSLLGDRVRRRLVTIAVLDYGDEDTEFIEGMKEQLQALDVWWRAPDLGDRRFAPEQALELQHCWDLTNFLHEIDLHEAPAEDAIVLFISGHGHAGSGGSHYFLLPKTQLDRLPVTAYRTADLVLEAIGSHAEHVLVIVNTCQAHGADIDLSQLRADLSAKRANSPTVVGLATTDIRTTVGVRNLSHLLAQVQQQLRTSAQLTNPYLSFAEFLEQLNLAAEAIECKPPKALFGSDGSSAKHLCLPNPGYQPALVAPERSQVATSDADMRFWISRASGRPHRTDPGWYFSGRQPLTRALADFLRDGPLQGRSPSLIITGTAGSGKSAVIGRAVTLSDSGFRADPAFAQALVHTPTETVPPVGSVDVAVRARQRSAEGVIAALLDGIGGKPPTSRQGQDHLADMREALLEALHDIASTGKTVTFVIDGLDEADDPYRLIPQLIAPLAQTRFGTPKLIIGVRSHLTKGAPAADDTALLDHLRRALTIRLLADADIPPLELRTDGPDTVQDIQAYLQALLDDIDDHSFDVTETAGRITRHIPAVSFLDARIAGDQIREADHPGNRLNDPYWWDSLGQGLVGLLGEELRGMNTPELPPETALGLLRAAAFAQGAGIPWGPIWPAVTEAILDRPLPDADAAIAALRASRLVGYFAQDAEDGRIVYRLAHERLAEVLRDEPHRLYVPKERQ